MKIHDTRFTTRGTAAFLLGVCLLQSLTSINYESASNALGAMVCLIAFLHHVWMFDSNVKLRTELRFSDWIVTCPILLWELYIITGQESIESLTSCIILVTCMLALGFGAAHSKGMRRAITFCLSSVCFVILTLLFMSGVQENREIAITFFLVWAIYPICFLLDSTNGFNVLDMISKGFFGIYVALITSKSDS